MCLWHTLQPLPLLLCAVPHSTTSFTLSWCRSNPRSNLSHIVTSLSSIVCRGLPPCNPSFFYIYVSSSVPSPLNARLPSSLLYSPPYLPPPPAFPASPLPASCDFPARIIPFKFNRFVANNYPSKGTHQLSARCFSRSLSSIISIYIFMYLSI